MKKKLGISLAVVALMIGSAFAVPAVAETEEHCPDHEGHTGKVEGGDLNDVVPAEGTVICVKAGNPESGGGATGKITADGESTLCDYLIDAGIVDGSGDTCRDVSYYIVYESEIEPTPEPTPTSPEPTPTPEPTPPAPEPTPPAPTPPDAPDTPDVPDKDEPLPRTGSTAPIAGLTILGLMVALAGATIRLCTPRR